jgi:hypothetical protein
MMQTMMIMYGGFAALMILFVLTLVVVIGVSRIVVAVRGKLGQRKMASRDSETSGTNPR